MSVVDLINYLRLKAPYDLKRVPTTSEEDAPPSGDELTDEEGDPKEEGDDPIKIGPIEESNLKEDQSEEESMEEEDPEEDPSKREPLEEEDPEKDLEEDPEEDPSEREPTEEEDPEEDPEEDSEVSEGQLVGSEDLEVDFNECETEHIEKKNLERD